MNTYSVKMECTNCEWKGQKDFKKGTPVQNGTECPHCGCKTLRRPLSMEPINPPKPWVPDPWKKYKKEIPPQKYVKPYDPNDIPDIRLGVPVRPSRTDDFYYDGHWVKCLN